MTTRTTAAATAAASPVSALRGEVETTAEQIQLDGRRAGRRLLSLDEMYECALLVASDTSDERGGQMNCGWCRHQVAAAMVRVIKERV